jgi:hypothetical protein
MLPPRTGLPIGTAVCVVLCDTFALIVLRYDINGDCVDDGGKEHSAIGKRLEALKRVLTVAYARKQTMCSYRKSSTKLCLELRTGMTSSLQSSAIALRD